MAKARILAVDDQLYFRTFLEGLLTEEGYAVQTASGGEEALHILERERFDVVITDLVMPGMDGRVLVQKLKERLPDQEVIVVSGVGDVQTAVDAMKDGATDYLLKPIERTALVRGLESILQSQRLREEHAQLMRENLEYMGVLSLYERAVGLFSTLAPEPACERTLEALCLETRAQTGVIWAVGPDGSEALELAAARGLVQVDEEPAQLEADRLPVGFSALSGADGAVLAPDPRAAGERQALLVPLRRSGRLIGLVRLTDKLEDQPFDDRDRAAADKVVELATVALANALHVAQLERRSFRDPATKAYTLAYLEDVVRNEIQKADRFGRSFAVLAIALEDLGSMRRKRSGPELARWLEGFVYQIGRALRSTDLVATNGDGRFHVLLPETDALGAAVLKRRILELLRAGDYGETRLALAAASYPADGTQLDAMTRVLDERLEADRTTLVHELELEGESFAASVDALLQRAGCERSEVAEQAMRLLIDEVGRRPRDRGLLFVAPGGGPTAPVREALERLRDVAPLTEVVLVGDGKSDALAGVPVTCVSARRAGTRAPFLVYFGEGPAYALVRERSDEAGRPPLFHTGDRPLVEHLAFQLQRDLGISLAV